MSDGKSSPDHAAGRRCETAARSRRKEKTLVRRDQRFPEGRKIEVEVAGRTPETFPATQID
jgi:hypothetical protein